MGDTINTIVTQSVDTSKPKLTPKINVIPPSSKEALGYGEQIVVGYSYSYLV
jgi:hypothetical protein